MGVKLGLWNRGRNITEGVWEQGAEEDIWTEEGWGDGRVKKTVQRGASWFVLFAKFQNCLLNLFYVHRNIFLSSLFDDQLLIEISVGCVIVKMRKYAAY
jgi:hypothetical protein